MADIFVSYARQDRPHAHRIAQALEAEGWSVWWDVTIPTGKAFDQTIQGAIDSAQCVVVLWSTTSVKSEWVREEADEGRRRGILIPIQIEHDVQIPMGFRRIQTATLVGWDGAPTDTTFKRLVRDISAIIPSQPRTDDQGKAQTTVATETIAKTRKWSIRPHVTVVVTAMVTTLLVSAAVLVYVSERPAPAPTVAKDLAASVAESKHKIAYNVIQSGSERARSACNQFDELKRKEAGLRSARLIQDSNLEDGFKKQIQHDQANIADAVKEYSGFLAQLANTDPTIVKEEFDRYNSALEERKAVEQIQIARMMKRHYERQQGGSGDVNRTLLGADCAALAKS